MLYGTYNVNRTSCFHNSLCGDSSFEVFSVFTTRLGGKQGKDFYVLISHFYSLLTILRAEGLNGLPKFTLVGQVTGAKEKPGFLT